MSYDHASRLAQHEMKEAVCRSFQFKRPGSSAYWFNLMWIPGKLILTGDGCNITLTHFQACSSFDAAIKWASESEMDYLLRKADQQQQYDPQATLQDILRWANAPVIGALKGVMDERHLFGDDERNDPRRIMRRHERAHALSLWGVNRNLRDFYDFDPCWSNWLSLWKDTAGTSWLPGSKCNTPPMVTTKAGRRYICRLLEGRLHDLADARLECFYQDHVDPAYCWTRAQEYQIEAIQHACRQIISAGLIDTSVQVP